MKRREGGGFREENEKETKRKTGYNFYREGKGIERLRLLEGEMREL